MASCINDAVKAFDDGKHTEGAQAYQAKVLDTIKEHGLSEVMDVHAKHAAVHPDNRDGSGLVPIDVHDLFEILMENGWDYASCTAALACEIHSACVIPRWRASLAVVWGKFI